MCVRAQTADLGIVIRRESETEKRKQARESKVEITNPICAEEGRQARPRLLELQPTEASFRQPTAAEVSLLTFRKLRYACSRAQELSNEFARLLNRGSSLE